MDNKRKSTGVNEGEGNKTADKSYRDGVEQFKREDDPAKRAREAATEIEKDKSGTYKKAEDEGKKHIAEEDPEIRR